MKDLKRAYRRYKAKNLLKKRAKFNYYWLKKTDQSWASFWNEVQKGKINTWLRNTGVVCSCYMCSGMYKYKRPSKSEIKKLFLDNKSQ